MELCARMGEFAETVNAPVTTHSGVADTAKWQIVVGVLKHHIVFYQRAGAGRFAQLGKFIAAAAEVVRHQWRFPMPKVIYHVAKVVVGIHQQHGAKNFLTLDQRIFAGVYHQGQRIGGAIYCQMVNAAAVEFGIFAEPLQALAAELGERAHVITCNLSDKDSVEALPKAAAEAMGSVDILVNNAGITRDNLFMRMKDEEWESVLNVNLTSTMRLCRGVLRGMMKARWGRIINISSVVGATGNPGQGNYAASKAGMVGMSKSLAYEVANRGITVNAVAPGFIATAMTDKLNDNQKDAILTQIPAGRMGDSKEIASAVLYLASQEAGYVTGTTLHVNGGMAMI